MFGGVATLFSARQKGGYYDFTDLSTLAANSDGSGSAVAIGGDARWCRDLSPNGNHLRNIISSVVVQPHGVATSGTNYGLFNMPGFGNWPMIAEPITMVACFEILSFGATDDRLIGSSGSGQILQGTRAGSIRLFSNYSPEVVPGLNREVVVTGVWNGPKSSIALNRDTPITWTSSGGAMNALCIGSATGPGPCAAVRFKRLFVREGLLSTTDRDGVLSWAGA
ncbi:hypothetical protein M8312_06860 [Sphingomonas sp. KRR8]|uniref:hypothetical protein n=1 Tax=Sphingomonas sp. KRR8 TaxID=2942996 RepID=UPI002020859E|nr:hypothetical protein [Sphingomonas sp. KRR8]URD62217.1 hypothetical protein M8312_06860 [Sphingomonas sp. KRR8]